MVSVTEFQLVVHYIYAVEFLHQSSIFHSTDLIY